MKAITLTAPWAWAVAHAGKDVENRTRRCPSLLGERIAIHAGVVTKDGVREVDEFGQMRRAGLITTDAPLFTIDGLRYGGGDPLVFGAVVAVATVVGWVDAADKTLTHGEQHVGEAVFHNGAGSKWFTGPIGWLLHDVRALAEPVPARGKQGIWTMETNAEARILAQIGGA